MPGCGGMPAAGAPAAGGGRMTGAAVTWGLGAIIPGAGAPTPRPGPARPWGDNSSSSSRRRGGSQFAPSTSTSCHITALGGCLTKL